jgi:hypothetical protein
MTAQMMHGIASKTGMSAVSGPKWAVLIQTKHASTHEDEPAT